jgi:hypothetical protein
LGAKADLSGATFTGTVRTAVLAHPTPSVYSALFTNHDTGSVGIVATVATNKALTVRGAGSQTGDLQQWQRSDGTVVGRVRDGGQIGVGNLITGTAFFVDMTQLGGTQAAVRIRGAASQSANLQEWQNSAGTVLTKIEASGNIVAPNTTGAINSGTFILGSRNSGGELTLVRQSAATSNPGALLARLYFRDGTNAGTLRLCVRAGAAGAETTIFDNIPQ